jgi:hypothetical protein
LPGQKEGELAGVIVSLLAPISLVVLYQAFMMRRSHAA